MSAGIYRIRNLTTGKVYIGQTVDFEQRFRRHKTDLNCNVHSCTYLQRSFLKHGVVAFEFEVIEQVEDTSILTEREQFWITYYSKLGILYNICLVAGSALGTVHSAETREKISASKRGRKHTPEAIENMRSSHAGFKHSDESKLLISEVSKKIQADPEYRKRKSEIAKAKWQDPKFRASMLEKMQSGKAASVEGAISHSNKMKELWEDPDYRARVSAAIKAKSLDPESRKRRSEAVTKSWQKRREGN